MVHVFVAVGLVASDVEQQVQRPAEEQSQHDVDQNFGLSHRHVGLDFCAIDGHEDFIVFNAASVHVMSVVTQAPVVIRHEKSRVQDEANNIANELVGAEGAVTTLVCNNPKTSAK